MEKSIHVIGGGTFSHIRSHMALAAPAFGSAARMILTNLGSAMYNKHGHSARLHLTKMADPTSHLMTNDDIGALVDKLVANPKTKMIFMTAALCDFDGQIDDVASGNHAERLQSRAEIPPVIKLTPADKIIGRIRKTRKDIFAVGCKTTAGATPDAQYQAGLRLLKTNSLNLVLANDTITRLNMVITPEEARYYETTNRYDALHGLVEIAMARMTNTFTRSTVVDGDSVPWTSPLIPDNLRKVVDYCIENGAYKPFLGATVGHFAARIDDHAIVTSKRKHNFNHLAQDGMVRLDYDGLEKVIAHGAKPSVGGQSQRFIFNDHPEVDCIVHFHSPMRADAPDAIPHRSQKLVECGSHQCGRQTSDGIGKFGNLSAIMLDNHGPNVVFSKTTPAEDVIAFIDRNFDLSQKTGGAV